VSIGSFKLLFDKNINFEGCAYYSMESRDKVITLSEVSPADVDTLFNNSADELQRKVDETRDAYMGFIFPISRSDFCLVADVLEINTSTAQRLFKRGRAFSNFRVGERSNQITNHIFGTSILALRKKSLDSGLVETTDISLEKLVRGNIETVLEIADARSSWFGRIFFPSNAFSNAIGVFGGKVSPGVFFDVASKYDYSAIAGERKVVRGDFGIAVWLTVLGKAP
jgi:hypothetical protein